MNISSIIAEIDFTMCAAKVAKLYNYNEPIIVDKYDGRSYIIADELRHPIVERLVTKTNYVSNNINNIWRYQTCRQAGVLHRN